MVIGYYEATVVDYNGCQVVVDQIIEENPILSIENIEEMEINIYQIQQRMLQL